MNLEQLLRELRWREVYQETWPARAARYAPLPAWLPDALRAQLQQRYPQGVYAHQAAALEAFRQGHHVALTTGTASGKSLVFYLAALTLLAQDPDARIAALYPLKALGREQEDRWRQWLTALGWPAEAVARIDGDVRDWKRRQDILRTARVVLFTPDVLHASILYRLDDPAVLDFFRRLALIVVDEVHTYTGVFGSNAAFFFRRWRHALRLLRAKEPQWVAASATVRAPRQHLHNLFGVAFHLVDAAQDASPRAPLTLHLVEPPGGKDRLSALAELLYALAQHTGHRFVAFVDSRKQVEILSSIVRRFKPEAVPETEDDGEPAAGRLYGVLEQAAILPYRAGYEYDDRALIQHRLTRGDLKGVISTSALELGIDIGHLDVAVLVGVPPTMTSFTQRIGRVGRQGPGHVVVVNTGSPQDRALFRHPQEALHRPPAESTLYLENRYLQYIHALCLAALPDGEDARLRKALQSPTGAEAPDDEHAAAPPTFETPVAWPPGFARLCQEVRTGQVARELSNWALGAQNDVPQRVYPLRDIEPQFEVVERRGGIERHYGRLSHYQVLNEAYPGAVYYYVGQPLRVLRVSQRSRRVLVKRERHYTTTPIKFARVQPSLRPEAVYQAWAWGSSAPLVALETELTITEEVSGYKEVRGTQRTKEQYPNLYWELPRFKRAYYSTGVVLTHPALAVLESRQARALAERLLEAFLLTVPLERQEIGVAVGHWAVGHAPFFEEGQPFIAFYERVYGGLHLTGRLLEDLPRRLQQVLTVAQRWFDQAGILRPPAEHELLATWLQHLETHEPQPVSLDPLLRTVGHTEGDRVRVIAPGSRGRVESDHQLKDFLVRGYFYSPTRGLQYKGVLCAYYLTEPSERNTEMQFGVEEVRAIPGVSCMGWYHLETGEFEPDPAVACRAEDDCQPLER